MPDEKLSIKGSAPRSDGGRSDSVRAELIRILYHQAVNSMVATAVIAAVLVFVVRDRTDHHQALIWLGGMYCVVLIRVLSIVAYRREPREGRSAARWGWAAAAMTTALGLGWAVAPLLLLDPQDPVALMTMSIILMGNAAGAAVALVSYLPSFFGLVYPSLGALILRLLVEGGEVSLMIAVLGAVALAAYTVQCLNVHRLLVNSLKLTFENIALRREAEEKSMLLEATLQSMSQGISVLDREGRARMWNRRLLDMLPPGVDPYDPRRTFRQVLIGLSPPLVLGPESRQEYATADGAVLELAVNPMPDGGAVITYTDVTDARRREVALEESRLQAERANTAKTSFLAAASHDLRQPIHALGLFFAALSGRVMDPECRGLMDDIQTAIDSIESMLNSLLDISKLDAGIIEPAIAEVSLCALFAPLRSEFAPIAAEGRNGIGFRAANLAVRTDAKMLEQVLRNLIHNALRYTHHGRVLVAARGRGDRIEISVFDTGIGIPQESQEEIFTEFHQLHNPEHDRRRGLGLGLAIVRRTCALLEHPLELFSVPGRGSRFRLWLPRASQREVRVGQSAADLLQGPDPLAGLRVLVLDDDRAVLGAMRTLLEHWRCEVTAVTCVSDALDAIAEPAPAPDLILADYRLPWQESGLDAVSRINAALNAPARALLITADTAPDRLREARLSGLPLLHKPVQPAKLRAAMQHLIRRVEQQNRDARPPRQGAGIDGNGEASRPP